jgi:hypothetical protein
MVLFAPMRALRGRVTGRNLGRSCHSWERTMARQFRTSCDWPHIPQPGLTTALDPRAERISGQAASVMATGGKPTFGLGDCFTGRAQRAEPGEKLRR